MTNAISYDPKLGQAFQGDVVLLPLPADICVARGDEIPMRDGMLVLAEGEVTGHHHAIRYGLAAAARFNDEGLARQIAVASPPTRSAHLFRDPQAVDQLLRRGVLTTGDLCIGFLVVEGDAPPLTHDEHAPIQIPAGNYYVGAKREQDAADVRRVVD